MTETCLSAGHLALVIFGAIFGTLAICVVFFILIWRWLRRNNDSKIFYLQRTDGVNPTDSEAKRPRDAESGEISRTDRKLQVTGTPHESTTQQSLVLSGNRQSTSSPLSSSQTSNLCELGVTIRKIQRSGFEIESIEKTDCSFLIGDRLTELTVRLDQLALEDAATLLELLVPYRIQLEVLRAQVPAELQQLRSEEVEIAVEIRDDEKEFVMKLTEEQSRQRTPIDEVPPPVAPRLPSVSPPRSPISTERANSLNLQDDSFSSPSDDKLPTEDEVTTRRLATRIPTPKSARGISRLSAERTAADSNADRSDPLPPKPSTNDYGQSFESSIDNFQYEKRESLPVSSEETDEFGLTAQQYNTLESNRRRLERERQQLRELGILS